MRDFLEGLTTGSARRVLSFGGALLLVVGGLELLSIQASIENNTLEFIAHGVGLISSARPV